MLSYAFFGTYKLRKECKKPACWSWEPETCTYSLKNASIF